MKILFGMKLDGARWTYDKSSIGTVTYGPMQMLAWLEEYLGLSGVFASEPERINEYLQKIKETDPAWCKKSFSLDAWSTSKQMLSWRDELVLNGWDKQSGESSRLSTLVEIEKSKSTLSPGFSDRLLNVLNQISSFSFNVDITLYDSIELLPYLWKETINALKNSGAKLSEFECKSAIKPKVIKLTSENEFVLARECVRYLSNTDCSTTAIICEENTSVLDGLLSRADFGKVGNPYRSKWRESLQVLPLWLNTLWKPFSAQKFLDLISLSYSPIPKVIRKHLSVSLQNTPGKGGESWSKAWENIKSDILKNNKENLEEEVKKVKEIWNLLSDHSFFAVDTVSEKDLSERCDILIKKMAPQSMENPELKLVISQTKTFKKLIEGKEIIKETEIDRMLDSIISTGTDGYEKERNYTEFDVYKDPGMILKDYKNIIWWNCVGSNSSISTNWTAIEINAMKDYSKSAIRKIDSTSWHNAVSHAKENLICFVPKVLNGEEVFAHPILDEFDEKEVVEKTDADLVNEKGLWSFLEAEKNLKASEVYEPTISNSFDAEKFTPKRLSYSQLNDLISCPVKWMLNYHIGLKQAPSMNVPTENQMIGTFAHKVVENIYKDKKTLTESEAKILAEKEFDNLVLEMAAELLEKGREVDLSRKKTTLVESVQYLVHEINAHGLTVEENEKELNGEFDGVPFIGYSDIVLKDKNGDEFVIDMKWSNSNSYETHYKNDEALQLAIYSWLIDENKNINCAYYLFPKKKFIYEENKNWHTLMVKAKKAYRERLFNLKSGILKKNDPLDDFSIDLGCEYCDFKDFCDVLEDCENE